MDIYSFPGGLHSFSDIVWFYNSIGINAVSVQTSFDELESGDIVQLKNSDSGFLIFQGTYLNGDVILEDLYHKFVCSPKTFNLLFTGNGIYIYIYKSYISKH